MALTLRQLSSLNEMGIPIWVLRTQKTDVTISNSEAAQDDSASTQTSEQIISCDWLVMIEPEHNNQQAQRLLQAMLYASGLTADNVAIVSPEQWPQIQTPGSQKKVLLVFGGELTRSVLGDSVVRGEIYQTLAPQLTTVVTFSLEELLTRPENKVLAWHDLQLAQSAITQ